jgi:hypothetical protein
MIYFKLYKSKRYFLKRKVLCFWATEKKALCYGALVTTSVLWFDSAEEAIDYIKAKYTKRSKVELDSIIHFDETTGEIVARA